MASEGQAWTSAPGPKTPCRRKGSCVAMASVCADVTVVSSAMHRRSKTTAWNWAYGSASRDSSSSAAGPCSPGRPGSWALLPTQTAGSAGSCVEAGGWYRTPSPEKPIRTWVVAPPLVVGITSTATPAFHGPALVCGPHTVLLPSVHQAVVFATCLCVCWGHRKKGTAGSPRSAGRAKGVASRGVPIPPSTALSHPWHPVQGQMVPGPEGKLEGLYPCTLIISL